MHVAAELVDVVSIGDAVDRMVNGAIIGVASLAQTLMERRPLKDKYDAALTRAADVLADLAAMDEDDWLEPGELTTRLCTEADRQRYIHDWLTKEQPMDPSPESWGIKGRCPNRGALCNCTGECMDPSPVGDEGPGSDCSIPREPLPGHPIDLQAQTGGYHFNICDIHGMRVIKPGHGCPDCASAAGDVAGDSSGVVSSKSTLLPTPERPDDLRHSPQVQHATFLILTHPHWAGKRDAAEELAARLHRIWDADQHITQQIYRKGLSWE